MDGKWRLAITKIGLRFQENTSSLVKMELSSSDDLFWNQTAGGAPFSRPHVICIYVTENYSKAAAPSGQAAVIRSANNNPKNYIPAFTKGRNPPPCWAAPSVSVSHWWQTVFASYRKHHFAYNHTSSCCCHGDGRLKRYASDCLSGSLCLSARGPPLIHVAISSIGLGGVALGRVWGTLGPAWSRAARTTAPPPHHRLLLFIWREAARASFFFLGGSLWAHDSSLLLFHSVSKNLNFHVARVTSWTVISHVRRRRFPACQCRPVYSAGSSTLHLSQEMKY